MSGHVMKSIGTFAAVLSLIQGLIWTILCILAILVYNCVILPEITGAAGTFIETFVSIYFTGGASCGNTDTSVSVVSGVTSPDDVLIWMCVYLAFSVLWVITAITWLVDLHREGRPPVSLYLWCGATSLTLILDLTATVWFGTDVASARRDTALVKLPLLLSTALMMTMAARGFILYLVNAGLLVVVATLAIRDLKKEQRPAVRPAAKQSAYVNPAMSSMWPERDQTSLKDSWEPRTMPTPPRYPTYINPPMSPTYDDMPPRSQPPVYLQDPPKGRVPPPEPPSKYIIPDPDYSPPTIRAYPQPMLPLRPALKKTHPSQIGRTVF